MKFSPQLGLGAVILGMVVVAGMAAGAQTIPASQQLAQSQGQGGNLVTRLSLRITQLENEIRRLTGQNEELSHRLRLLQTRLDKAAGDLEQRLKALEGGTKPPQRASAEAAMATDVPPTGGNAAKPAAVREKASVPGADKGARVLGKVSTSQSGSGAQAARVVPVAPTAKKETPEQKYDRAHSLIVKHRKYGEAETVLRTFIASNPKHTLAPNAHYWLGRTFFVRGDYENAAFAFAEGFQKFPKSEKAPANLLNLGMSLSRLGKNREACTTYTRLLRTYRDAEDSVKRRVTRERGRAKCRQR
jgi:tol-pal system protein YbgF